MVTRKNSADVTLDRILGRGWKLSRVIRATSLYKFLRECNNSPLDKIVLDCGAGGKDPPLQVFSSLGYKTCGIDIAESNLRETVSFGEQLGVDFCLLNADMRHIPFRD